MSLPWSADLHEVVERARMSSGHAGTLPTTATVLRAMLAVSGDARLFLRNEGVEETLLGAVAHRTQPEPPGVLDRVFVRATHAALAARHHELNAVHVLHALT